MTAPVLKSSGRGSAPDFPAGSSSPISGVDDTSAKASREKRWSGGWTQQALSWRPTVLEVVVRRYRCSGCGHVWHQDTSAANSRSRSMSSKAPGGPLPGIDAPAIATPSTGKSRFAGCGSGPRVWEGNVNLPKGEHRLKLSSCPQGTNVPGAYSNPRVVRFLVTANGSDSLPSTGSDPG